MTATINGRTPEEIKKGLECCNAFNACLRCPYEKIVDTEHGWGCVVIRNADPLAYIQQLEHNWDELFETAKQLERERDEARDDLDTLSYANTELHSAYEAMKRERDAAVNDLETMGEDRAYCDTCLHNNTDHKAEPCSSCMSGYLINNWQWRGVQEVE